MAASDRPAIPICSLAPGPDLDPAESNVASALLSAETTTLEDLLGLRGSASNRSVPGLGAGSVSPAGTAAELHLCHLHPMSWSKVQPRLVLLSPRPCNPRSYR
jgi:hypothetical protein